MLIEQTLTGFCAVLGSDAPAPGGGSVAALSGALGANLANMVAALSYGRVEFAAHEQLLTDTLSQAGVLSKRLLERVDLDTEAFNGVMVAFKLPKATDAEKAARSAAIQTGYQEAVQSPLGIAADCLAVLKLAGDLAGRSNPNTLSDLGVAAEMALAGLEGAVMNVRINLPSIKDAGFVAQTTAQADAFLVQGRDLRSNVYQYVQEHIQ